MDIRERIITESGQLFARFGIKSVTMDSLAEEMGISKRTIYENFRDKDNLLAEVILHFKKQQMEESNTIIEESENVVVALFKILNRSISMMKQVNPLLFHDLKKYHAQLNKKFMEKGDIRDYSVTLNILQLGIKQNIFNSNLNVSIVNMTLHELFNLFSPDSPLTRADYRREDLFDNIIIPYLLGLSTEKGRELINQHKLMIE